MEIRTVSTAGTVDLSAARAVFSRLGLGAFVFLLVTYAIQIVIGAVLGYVDPYVLDEPLLLLLMSYIPMYCIALPIGCAIMRKVPAHPLEQNSLRRGQLLKIVPICFFLMYGGNILGSIINESISDAMGIYISDPVEDFVMSGIPMPALFILTVILAPVFEELVFRKLLIDRMNVYGQGTAIVTSALMFGLFHGNLSQFFYAAALGLAFGYVYTKTGKLRYSIGLHMFVNFWGGIVSGALMMDDSVYRIASEGLDLADLTEAQLQEIITVPVVLFVLYTLVTIVLAIAGCVLMIKSAKHASLQAAPLQLPRGTGFATVWLNAGMILLTVLCIVLMATTILGGAWL
ncbi:MAG: CPBP family intramembrane metalloprotease [Firmicutes bacterium]|nr:CPBP family intramembrane metalloprotease [Bacillota bacterium]